MNELKYIFLHGLGQNSSNWQDTISNIENKSDILCPNLSDFLYGKEMNYANLYESFSEYCTHFSEPITICGLSLGGILALQYGIENPDKINSMVLIGTQYKMPKNLLKFQNFIFHLMPNCIIKKTGFQKRDFINLSKSMININFEKNLKKINCPVLIICGEKDKANKQASLQLKEHIPNSEIIFIKNAGHEVNVDASKILGTTLNTFFKQQ